MSPSPGYASEGIGVVVIVTLCLGASNLASSWELDATGHAYTQRDVPHQYLCAYASSRQEVEYTSGHGCLKTRWTAVFSIGASFSVCATERTSVALPSYARGQR